MGLLALAHELRAAAKSPGDQALPIGTLTTPPGIYPQPRYGYVRGKRVTIHAESNMVGFSPVTLCTDENLETEWIPTGLVLGRQLEPFAIPGNARGAGIGTPAPPSAASRARARRAQARAAAKPAA